MHPNQSSRSLHAWQVDESPTFAESGHLKCLPPEKYPAHIFLCSLMFIPPFHNGKRTGSSDAVPLAKMKSGSQLPEFDFFHLKPTIW
jgi:hypothetical protein